MYIVKSVYTRRGVGGREMPIELLRSWQLPGKKREEGVLSLEKLTGGGGGGWGRQFGGGQQLPFLR